MVECSDGTIYTGITNNVEERINKHNSGKGAKYTRARIPVVLRAWWPYKQKSEAAKAEYAFKKLNRKQKMEIILVFDISKTGVKSRSRKKSSLSKTRKGS
jgi:putative endonuclease